MFNLMQRHRKYEVHATAGRPPFTPPLAGTLAVVFSSLTVAWSPCTPAAAAASPGFKVLHRVTLGGEGGWDYLNADGLAQRLYISRGTRVDVVDLRTNRIVGHIENTQGVHGIALAPHLHRGFTSDGRANAVTVFDLRTLKTIGSVPVGQRPDAIIFDDATNRVFTCNGGSNDATAIDAATAKVVGTVPLGGRPEFAAADGRGSVFINLEDKSALVHVDSRRLRLLHTWPLAPGESPSGLAIDRVHHRLFSTCDNNIMTVVNADTGKVVATPAIGRGPDAGGYDQALGLAFSSNGEDGTLSVIHEDGPNHFTVAQTLPTAPGARTMTLDPQTHRIYLVTATPTPGAPAEGRRRSYVPGSFTLLVVGR